MLELCELNKDACSTSELNYESS